MRPAVRYRVIVIQKEVDFVVAFGDRVDCSRHDILGINQFGFRQEIDRGLTEIGSGPMDGLGDVIGEGARLVVVLIHAEPGDH